MVIAFSYNVKKAKYSSSLEKQTDIEFDSPFVIDTIAKTITKLGHKVIKIEADENAYIKLKKLKRKIDLVFNIAEGKRGIARESQIPLFCEMLDIPYTHSDPTVCALTLNKSYSKSIVSAEGICLTPKSQIFTSPEDKLNKKLNFPLIIKPNHEGSSKGIMDKNVVDSANDLKKRLKIMLSKLNTSILAEEYIEGREFTVSLINDNGIKVLPVIEQKFDFLPPKMHKIASYELKWFLEDSLKKLTDAYDCPAKLSSKLQKKIDSTSIAIFEALGLRDCARIDYRLKSNGDLYFIEINALPGINPNLNEISYFPISARTAGYSYEKMIKTIITSALERK